MKAILEFNLDDADDIISHERCVKAEDMAIILWELVHNIQKKTEYLNDDIEPIDYVFNWINEEMQDRGINIDKLLA